MTNTSGTTLMRAGRREWIGLAVLALPTLLVSLDMSVLFLAQPAMSVDLDASGTQQLWILDIYGFMIAGFLITMGTLGDRIGRRKLLLIGASAFTAASLLAAYSVSAEMLIAARALLGIAGATLAPSTLALISNMFALPRQRAIAIAAWMSCFMAGNVVGPVVGGVLLEWFWWGSVFLLGVPVMILLLIVGPVLLPEYRDTTRTGRLDLISVGLSLGAILPAIYGLKELAKEGWSASAAVAVGVGVVVGTAFVARQRRLADPLLDLRLFADRTASAALGIMLIGAVLMAGTFLFVPTFLQLVAEFTPLEAGLWLVPQSIAMIASTQAAPLLARRFRPAYVIATSLLIAATGTLLMTFADADGGLPLVLVGFLLACVGIAPPTALGVDLIVGSAPPERAGSASSVSESVNEFGIAIGMAALGSLGTAVYRGHLEMPAGVGADSAEVARESISRAGEVAEHLPSGAADALLGSAREAFTAGVNTVAGVGTVLFAVLAVVALAWLRGAGKSDPVDPADPADTLDVARVAA